MAVLTIGPATAIRPGAGTVNSVPMLLQSAEAPIEPMPMVSVGGRRSVTSGSPPMRLDQPAAGEIGVGFDRAGEARAGAVLRGEDQGAIVGAVPRRELVEEGGEPALAGGRGGAGGGLGAGAFADLDRFAAGDRDRRAVEPVESGIAAAAPRAMVEEAAGAEIDPALEAAEILVADALERPLPAERIDARRDRCRRRPRR